MNCLIVVETDCCTHNCSQAAEQDTTLDEYEVGSSDEESEENVDRLSMKTQMG